MWCVVAITLFSVIPCDLFTHILKGCSTGMKYAHILYSYIISSHMINVIDSPVVLGVTSLALRHSYDF